MKNKIIPINSAIIFLVMFVLSFGALANTYKLSDPDGKIYEVGTIATAQSICKIMSHPAFDYYQSTIKPWEFFSYPLDAPIILLKQVPENIRYLNITEDSRIEIASNTRACAAELLSANKKGYEFLDYFSKQPTLVPSTIQRGYLDGSNRNGTNFNFFLMLIGLQELQQAFTRDLDNLYPTLKTLHDRSEAVRIDQEQQAEIAKQNKIKAEEKTKADEEEKKSEFRRAKMMSQALDYLLLLGAAVGSVFLARLSKPWLKKRNLDLKSKYLVANIDNAVQNESAAEENPNFISELTGKVKKEVGALGKLEGWFDMSDGKNEKGIGKIIRDKVEKDRAKGE